jgi:single-strand DNA-binding protein
MSTFNTINITVQGRLVSEPALKVGKQSGAEFLVMRVASTPRLFSRERRAWYDGATIFMDVLAFSRALTHNCLNSLHKGDPVVVTGEMRCNEWQRQDGSKATRHEMVADAIGHDLNYGRTSYVKVSYRDNVNADGEQIQSNAEPGAAGESASLSSVSDAGAPDAGQPGFAASAGGVGDAASLGVDVEDPEIEEAVLAMAAA